jgi:hypothetical protein
MYNNKKTKTKGSQNKNSFAPLFWEDETSDDVDKEKKKVCYYRHSRHLTWQEEEGYSDVVIFINERV